MAGGYAWVGGGGDSAITGRPKWKAKGVPVLPGNNNCPDQALGAMPDGVRIEILEAKTQTMPIRDEHVHF